MPEDQNKIVIEIDDTESEDGFLRKKTARFLVFMIGSEHYAVAIAEAREVVELAQVTRVPNVPPFISGVMNLRGEVIALCDIRYFLGIDPAEKTRQTRAVVSDVTGAPIAILVDQVKEAMDIEEAAIQPPLATLNAKLARYTRGQAQVGNDILIFLDLGKLLCCDEMERLKKGE